MSQPQVISTQRHQLAEGPFWSASEQALYWVDIPACQVWRWHQPSNHQKSWTLPSKVSAVFTTQGERLLLCLAKEVVYFDPATGEMETLCAIDADIPHNRCNDAKCDPAGRLWVGTMDDNEQQRSGRLWQVGANAVARQWLDGIGISNTLAWDEVRERFYFGDSMRGAIHAYSWPELDDVRAQAAFIRTPEGMGPDGSAIDSEGCLWNAQWDGWRVVRYSPEGEELAVISLPFARPTSCAFGGPAGSTLFITSASQGLSTEQLAKQPLAGQVLAIEVGVKGAPGQSFAGA